MWKIPLVFWVWEDKIICFWELLTFRWVHNFSILNDTKYFFENSKSILSWIEINLIYSYFLIQCRIKQLWQFSPLLLHFSSQIYWFLPASFESVQDFNFDLDIRTRINLLKHSILAFDIVFTFLNYRKALRCTFLGNGKNHVAQNSCNLSY